MRFDVSQGSATAMLPIKVHPVHLLSAIGLYLIGAMLLMVWLALQERILEIDWQLENGLVVAYPVGQSEPITLDQIVLGNGEYLTLDADTLIRDPDVLPHYEDVNRFMENQERLHQTLQADQVELIDTDGQTWIVPVRDRTLADLPFGFFFQLICGSLGLLIAGGVWSYRPYLRSAQMFFLCGFGFTLVSFTMGTYAYRELAMSGEIFTNLMRVNRFSVVLLSYGGAVLLWLYPKRLSHFPFISLVSFTGAAIWINETLQWFEWPLHAYFSNFILCTLAALIAGYQQWRRSRFQPLERAALRWLLLSFLICFTGIWLLYVLPIIFIRELTLNLELASFLVLSVFIGVALGISRYRLFDLDRWWLETWLWFLSGLTIVVVDVMLVFLLNMGFLSSLALTVLFVGWLYFPVRQWVLSRMLARDGAGVEHLLPDILTFMLKPHKAHEPDMFWASILQKSLNPIHIATEPAAREAIQIEDDGLVMAVPRINHTGYYELAGCQKGQRLFNSQDLHRIRQMHQLLAFGEAQYRHREQATERERNRIMRDLHDDVGAKLLTLIHRLPTENADLAREALATLRDTIFSMRPDNQCDLQEFLASQREEFAYRCEGAGCQLNWNHELDHDYQIDAHIQINLSRVMREALTNILKHARPDWLTVTIEARQKELRIELEHNGETAPVASWIKSNGLINMKRRMTELNGHIDYRDRAEGGVITQINLTLDATP